MTGVSKESFKYALLIKLAAKGPKPNIIPGGVLLPKGDKSSYGTLVTDQPLDHHTSTFMHLPCVAPYKLNEKNRYYT